MAGSAAGPLTLLLVLVSGLFLLSSQGWEAGALTRASSSLFSINHVVIIMMENHPLNVSACCGGTDGIIGNSAAPYITQLARNNSLAENYLALVPGSLPNYLATTGGFTFNNVTCVAANSPPSSCSISASNIVDRIEVSGRTWKAYMEDYTGGCFGANVGTYDYFHNPFPYFTDVQSNATRCNLIVSANPGHVGLPDTQLLSDLNSTSTAPNYVWLTPNENDNMHSSSISAGDTYLSVLVPEILNSAVFMTENAALFIVWDEPTSCSCPVPAIWVGRTITPGRVSKTSYTHYSVLATMEALWNIPPLTTNDASATPMTEFFTSNGSVGGATLGFDEFALLPPYLFLVCSFLVILPAALHVKRRRLE